MFVEESIRTSDERVTMVLDEATPQALRDWAMQIEEQSSSAASGASAPEAMQLGRFQCLVDDAATALERLHGAYSQAGSIGGELQN